MVNLHKCERHNRFHWGTLCPVCMAVDLHPEEAGNIEQALLMRDALVGEVAASIAAAAQQAYLFHEKELAMMLYALAALVRYGLESPVIAVSMMCLKHVKEQVGLSEETVSAQPSAGDGAQSSDEGEDLEMFLREL